MTLMNWNWQVETWPNFTYEISDDLQQKIYEYGKGAGRLDGIFKQSDLHMKQELLIDLMVEEAIATSAIEGEYFTDADMRTALRIELGLSDDSEEDIKDLRAPPLARLMIEARKAFYVPLSKGMMCAWHELILSDPEVCKQMTVGNWRRVPVQIVAWSSMGSRRVVFEAPPPERVPKEMAQFISWFNDTDPNIGSIKMSGPVRAALAHLYFESIHPFSDGNGRVGRVLSEKALFQDLNSPVFISLSPTIEARKQDYYKQLSSASTQEMTITSCIEFFVDVVLEAQAKAEQKLTNALKTEDLLRRHGAAINDRQRLIIRKMAEDGPAGFIGGLSAKKYMALTGCCKATATRDLAALLLQGILEQENRGSATRYLLLLKNDPDLDVKR